MLGPIRKVTGRLRDTVRRPPSLPGVVSQACTYAQIDTPEYRAWCERMRQQPLCHRKQWEWVFILQALTEAGVVGRGHRGLGFGVGTEPLTPVLAAAGCTIVATDQPPGGESVGAWSETGQHAASVDALDPDGLCPADVLRERVTFRAVDMNHIPTDLTGFDLTWSACAFEHLGSLDAGARFVERSIECLRPGGVAVHTTEFNLSSDEHTIQEGPTVAYRRRDLIDLVDRLRSDGHRVRVTYHQGMAPQDLHVDVEPYTNTHLRTTIGQYAVTSFGLIITARRARSEGGAVRRGRSRGERSA